MTESSSRAASSAGTDVNRPEQLRAEAQGCRVLATVRRPGVTPHGLPHAKAIVGATGTLPTFLVGSCVIKFFAQRFETGWRWPGARASSSPKFCMPRAASMAPREIREAAASAH